MTEDQYAIALAESAKAGRAAVRKWLGGGGLACGASKYQEMQRAERHAKFMSRLQRPKSAAQLVDETHISRTTVMATLRELILLGKVVRTGKPQTYRYRAV